MKANLITQLDGQKERAPLLVVNSFNEWDPLEEVIVGVLDGASVPPWHTTLKATMPASQWNYFIRNGGRPFPQEQIDAGKKDLEEFVRILEAEGVTVRRPDTVNYSASYSTRIGKAPGGFTAAIPRDLLLVIGNEIIEAPMAWRSRYFEINSYRPLIKEYFLKGAGWSAGPKPQLSDQLYNYDYVGKDEGDEYDYVINEFEPTFDAADFVRCGKDIFGPEKSCDEQLRDRLAQAAPGRSVHHSRTGIQ